MTLSDAVREEIVRMGRAGMKRGDIAADLNVAMSTVSRVLADSGVAIRRSSVTDGFDGKAIAKEYSSGVPVRKILDEFGLTYNILYTILDQQGIKTRREETEAGIRKAADRAVEMYQKGRRVIDIVTETGISTFKLYSELAKRGIARRTEK